MKYIKEYLCDKKTPSDEEKGRLYNLNSINIY